MGGTNLYAFVENDPVNGWDYLGLEEACDPADSAAGLCDETPRRRGLFQRIGNFLGGIGKAIGGTGRALGNIARGVGNIGRGVINAAGRIGHGVVNTAVKVARAATEVEEQRVIVIIVVSASGESESGEDKEDGEAKQPGSEASQSGNNLDPYNVVGLKGLFESRTKADSDFRKALDAAIAKIKSSLIAKSLSSDPRAGEAMEALQRLSNGLATYNIEFQEIRHSRGQRPVGGPIQFGIKGVVRWDPTGTIKTNGVVSLPPNILAHEVEHALLGFELSREMYIRYKNFDTGPYTNLLEYEAIQFENLVRDPGDVRLFHDPKKRNDP